MHSWLDLGWHTPEPAGTNPVICSEMTCVAQVLSQTSQASPFLPKELQRIFSWVWVLELSGHGGSLGWTAKWRVKSRVNSKTRWRQNGGKMKAGAEAETKRHREELPCFSGLLSSLANLNEAEQHFAFCPWSPWDLCVLLVKWWSEGVMSNSLWPCGP